MPSFETTEESSSIHKTTTIKLSARFSRMKFCLLLILAVVFSKVSYGQKQATAVGNLQTQSDESIPRCIGNALQILARCNTWMGEYRTRCLQLCHSTHDILLTPHRTTEPPMVYMGPWPVEQTEKPPSVCNGSVEQILERCNIQKELDPMQCLRLCNPELTHLLMKDRTTEPSIEYMGPWPFEQKARKPPAVCHGSVEQILERCNKRTGMDRTQCLRDDFNML